jgi:L-fucose isomerase-like protein
MMITKVKVAVPVEKPDTPCWPCINHDYEKELQRVMEPLKANNPDIEFDIAVYTELEQAREDYDADKKKYDGVLVLLMTLWKDIELFYARQSKEGGLPVIIADVPYCGSGSVLMRASYAIRTEGLPVPLISSLDYNDIAKAARLFYVIKQMKDSKILVISDNVNKAVQEEAAKVWGCSFINRKADDLNVYLNAIDEDEAKSAAGIWKKEAAAVVEPSAKDIDESARLYVALKNMKKTLKADAVTVDCLTLSYGGAYGGNAHMYPCLSHYEMNKNGEVAVCEADINATLASLAVLFLTKRPGFVSDPVIDTSSDQIIYAHCVACSKVYGKDDPRTCKFYIRSHAEDVLGASVQVIFPAGEPLTTIMFNLPAREAVIHSSCSVGNVGGDEGCRSKLAAVSDTEALLANWMPLWHRVTVFGDYRKDFLNLFKMRGLAVWQEDKA